jgi:mannose-6-phosphate isomerase-like protein (cupin superfamily)
LDRQVPHQGQKLRDFKILIGTWHKVRELGQPQLEALGVLEQMQIRGTVQVRTRSLDLDGKAVVQRLDLEHRMRNTSSTGSQLKRSKGDQPGGRHLDWEWEGGATVQ